MPDPADAGLFRPVHMTLRVRYDALTMRYRLQTVLTEDSHVITTNDDEAVFDERAGKWAVIDHIRGELVLLEMINEHRYREPGVPIAAAEAAVREVPF